MELATISHYFAQYGLWAVFGIIFLEYLNLPGFPAGIIMPAAGMFAAQAGLHFLEVFFVSTIAGTMGCWGLFFLGKFGGRKFLPWFTRKYPARAKSVDTCLIFVHKYGYVGLFFARLIPAIRTLISFPVGAAQMPFWGYTLSSMLGIAVWNFVFVGSGYIFGDEVFEMLGG